MKRSREESLDSSSVNAKKLNTDHALPSSSASPVFLPSSRSSSVVSLTSSHSPRNTLTIYSTKDNTGISSTTASGTVVSLSSSSFSSNPSYSSPPVSLSTSSSSPTLAMSPTTSTNLSFEERMRLRAQRFGVPTNSGTTPTTTTVTTSHVSPFPHKPTYSPKSSSSSSSSAIRTTPSNTVTTSTTLTYPPSSASTIGKNHGKKNINTTWLDLVQKEQAKTINFASVSSLPVSPLPSTPTLVSSSIGKSLPSSVLSPSIIPHRSTMMMVDNSAPSMSVLPNEWIPLPPRERSQSRKNKNNKERSDNNSKDRSDNNNVMDTN